MTEFIRQLFEKWACKHEWEMKAKTSYSDCNVFLFVCTKCGKMKKLTI